MNKPFNGWVLLFCVLSLFTACTSKKNLLYFQGEGVASTGNNTVYNPIFQKDDLLSITVMGLDPDAVLPFNLPVTQLFPHNVGGYAVGAPTPPGYLVDNEGNIDFPVIGKMKVEGLTRTELTQTLKDKLKAYVNMPTINIRILNYKVTVLGEVRNPGTFTIPNERVTVLEAIGIAGDLLITGVRQTVLVIRDVNGKKVETRIDLTSKEVFGSPVYYLQQNDVVYVEPNRAKVNSSAINASNLSVTVSILSMLVTVATLLLTR